MINKPVQLGRNAQTRIQPKYKLLNLNQQVLV